MRNTSEIQPEIVHSDSHGQSEAVFGLAHLLGIELMPRIKIWMRLTFYRPVPPGSAPFAISILAISVLPLNSARARAVHPCRSLTLMLAPLSINNLARSAWLNHAAYMRAVMPSLSLTSISAPASSRRRTVSLWPLHTAFI